MQCQDVTKQRDQCPCLLWIPSPESAPGIICPDSTEDCSSGQQQDTELKYAIKPEMHRGVRACGCRIPRVSIFQRSESVLLSQTCPLVCADRRPGSPAIP